jgi:predicted  nucleic acid-binding Zn-ribbon protein
MRAHLDTHATLIRMSLEQHEPQTELETLRQRVIELEKQLATIRQRVRRHTIGLFDAVKQEDSAPAVVSTIAPRQTRHEVSSRSGHFVSEVLNNQGATHLP